MNKSAVIILLIVFSSICCSILFGGGGVYYFRDTLFSPSPAPPGGGSPPGGSPPAGTPLSRDDLIRSAQLVQGSTPLQTQLGNSSFTITGSDKYSGKAKYTYSMDINIFNVFNEWRTIFTHNGDDWKSGGRTPSLFVIPNTTDIHVTHSVNGENKTMNVTTGVGTDTYFNLLVTCDGDKITAYINGTKKADMSGDFKWDTSKNEWIWGRPQLTRGGSITVKNFYWLNRDLSESNIKTLMDSTTSGYTEYTDFFVEPFDRFKEYN